MDLWRCCSCYTVIALTPDEELEGANYELQDDDTLYVNSCRVCAHYRYYERVAPLIEKR